MKTHPGKRFLNACYATCTHVMPFSTFRIVHDFTPFSRASIDWLCPSLCMCLMVLTCWADSLELGMASPRDTLPLDWQSFMLSSCVPHARLSGRLSSLMSFKWRATSPVGRGPAYAFRIMPLSVLCSLPAHISDNGVFPIPPTSYGPSQDAVSVFKYHPIPGPVCWAT
jgi:hypothetical protein